jgi:hypothetical protein
MFRRYITNDRYDKVLMDNPKIDYIIYDEDLPRVKRVYTIKKGIVPAFKNGSPRFYIINNVKYETQGMEKTKEQAEKRIERFINFASNKKKSDFKAIEILYYLNVNTNSIIQRAGSEWKNGWVIIEKF